MADNANLGAAKTAKNDEFYTQYNDIEVEMNAYVEFNPDVFELCAAQHPILGTKSVECGVGTISPVE